MPFPPQFDKQEAQHYLALETVAGMGIIVLDGLRGGFFPGAKSYVPFLLTFGLLGMVALVPGTGGTVVIIGAIVLTVMLIRPDIAGSNTVGGSIVTGLSTASGNIGKAGMTRAQGYKGGN